MALYAIGDLHLHFSAPLKAKAQQKDRVWKNHEEKFKANCSRLLGAGDTLVLVGDHSWGRDEAESAEDLRWIAALPGRKILTRGNHDMFWNASKTAQLNARWAGELFFLQNNYAAYGDVALVGTKGHCFEGPFWLDARGRILGWDEAAELQSKKLVERELQRLRLSFEAARADGYRRFLVFLHYPPTSILEDESGFTAMAEEYGAEMLIYAHCHGEARFHDSLEGRHNGVEYRLVSGDCLKWQPLKLLD